MGDVIRRPVTAEITVISAPATTGWTCTVQVTEPNGQTRHTVAVGREELAQLTAGKSATPEQLVRKVFEFLLEREPKHHILRQFDLPTVTKHFPEFPSEILKKL